MASLPFSSHARLLRCSPTSPFPMLPMARARTLSFTPLRSKFSSFPRIYAFSSNDIKVGSNIEVDGAPWRVLEFLHVKPGKGAAFVRTKVRNYITGNTVEKTFRAGSTIQEANIAKETKQFTYKDGSQFVFMDLATYEETRLTEAEVGEKTKWLKEGMDCNVVFWNGRVIDFELPIIVKLTVVDVDPGVRGDTAQGCTFIFHGGKHEGYNHDQGGQLNGGSKPATLDTGAVINVPLFVNTGEEILVDTRTGQYTNRA